MATNYTGVDLDRYNAGNKFYSLNRHLQGIGLDKPAITFNPSQSNTGTTSQYGNNSMYGTPTNTGGSGGDINFGNFNQKDNLFGIGPNTNMQPNVLDEFGKNGQVYNNSLGQNINSLAGKVGNYGLRTMASQMGAQGGAMLGGMVPGAGILSMILGAGAGGKFGFDMSGRGPTDPERITANFYGNQGNSPMQYLNPITGELEDSEMQGYNISSAYGKGIPAAIQNRIDKIMNRRAAQTTASKDRIAALEKEKAALDAANQTQMNNMAANERSVLDDYFGGSGAGPGGNRYDGADTSQQYEAEPTAYSGSN